MAEHIKQFRLFEAHEIQVRLGQKTSNGDKISLLLFQDARAAMNRLDEEFGEFGWQREHREVNGAAYCGVSLWSNEHNCWVAKWDAGEASNPKTAPKKSEASDSFKRACVNWGIGRELYTAPHMYVDINTDTFGMSVSDIKYDDNRKITAITIVNGRGNVIYQRGSKSAPNRAQTAAKPQQTPAPAAPAAPAAPVTTKGGAIFPDNEPEEPARDPKLDEIYNSLDAREFEEYTNALANMSNTKSHQEALNVYSRYRDSKFAALLIDYGCKLKKERGWV